MGQGEEVSNCSGIMGPNVEKNHSHEKPVHLHAVQGWHEGDKDELGDLWVLVEGFEGPYRVPVQSWYDMGEPREKQDGLGGRSC